MYPHSARYEPIGRRYNRGMRILLTNDDGIFAPGMKALYQAMQGMGELHVVAPLEVRSATSHAVTFHKPMDTRRVTVSDETGAVLFTGMAVDANPADCVKLAVHHLVPQPIELVVSGINSGANVGVNVFYSGTVGAAREAAIWGMPAVAVSLHIARRDVIEWSRAAELTRTIMSDLIRHNIEPHTLLNVNLPVLDGGKTPHGLRVVPLCTSRIVEDYALMPAEAADGVSIENKAGDPAACKVMSQRYVASDIFDFHRRDPDTDVDCLFAGYTTLTPLSFDPTCAKGVSLWSQRLNSI